MNIEIKHAELFQTIFCILKEVISEDNINLIFDGMKPTNADKSTIHQQSCSGMKILSVDIANTILISLKINAIYFTKFECNIPQLTLGINLVSFCKILTNSIGKQDSLTFHVDNDNSDICNITVSNPTRGKELNFGLKLLELRKEIPVIPDQTFDVLVTISAQEFRKLCREMNKITECVEIICYKNKIEFICQGVGNYATYRTKDTNQWLKQKNESYKKDPDAFYIKSGGVTIECAHEYNNEVLIFRGIFKLEDLLKFINCYKLYNNVEIYQKNNRSMCIKYRFATLCELNVPIQQI